MAKTAVVGTSGFPEVRIELPPRVDFTPAADPHVQALVTENAQLKAERDQLASINARLTRKLANLRDGIGVLAERIKERE